MAIIYPRVRTTVTDKLTVKRYAELACNELEVEIKSSTITKLEYQIEALRKHGMANPKTGLQHKVVRVNFSEKIAVRDPFTMQKDMKHIKPFMVNNLVVAFERGQVALNPNDKHTIKQFQDYHVERWGQDGRPVYSSENEHIHDCIMLAMHGFIQKYSDMLKINTSVHISHLRKLDLGTYDEVKERNIEKEEKPQIPSQFSGLIGLKANRNKTRMQGRRSMGVPKRSTF